ncbi:hypothetical protein TrLO_g13647 [Triparma laevis f. longispina]|uniref:Uncharacterized protein n=1 Tax=Triparma laevis f. longispina TaxID=1714387 RepID=A0A9W6ZWD1_9STRA|nr:hypothetical protein TrLO_g13647 [Triparma laevis f. longispina]
MVYLNFMRFEDLVGEEMDPVGNGEYYEEGNEMRGVEGGSGRGWGRVLKKVTEIDLNYLKGFKRIEQSKVKELWNDNKRSKYSIDRFKNLCWYVNEKVEVEGREVCRMNVILKGKGKIPVGSNLEIVMPKEEENVFIGKVTFTVYDPDLGRGRGWAWVKVGEIKRGRRMEWRGRVGVEVEVEGGEVGFMWI